MSDPKRMLTLMYGMLEADGVESSREFVAMISTLHTQGNIPIACISNHLDTTEERIQEWLEGINLPEVVFMPVLVKKVMSLIKEELHS